MIALLFALAAPTPFPQASDLDRWRFFFEERAIQELWLEVSSAHEPRTVLFEGANVLAMTSPVIEAGVSVLVDKGRIAWIGPPQEARPPEGTLRVDAKDRYLMPGLADMHVHRLTTYSQPLLSLAHGVTTERDLCGFEWQLVQRERIRDGLLLAPDLHISSHILNRFSMGMYATVVTTPAEAKRFVDDQIEAGFDFIKVHNRVAPDVYRAVFERANELGVRVVGHVPHEITLEQALELGHHTLEHFKGYILDSTLELTTEDYVGLTDGSGAWNCPTLAMRNTGLVGAQAYEFLDTFPGMPYASIYERKRWFEAAESRDPNNSAARSWKLARQVFVDLLATDARFLTGTDSGGGYAHQVPGAMLQEELRLMEELGLPTYEALQAATIHAASALDSDEFGTIEVGKRADLILTDANPLDTAANLRRPHGVMVRGVWLSRTTIDNFLAKIEAIYAHGGEAKPLQAPSDEALSEYLHALGELHAAGFVFMDHHVDELAGLLAGRGRSDDASFVRGLRASR